MRTFQVAERRLHVVEFESVEFREERDTGGQFFSIVGHAAVFDRLSEDLGGFREQIARGSFRKSLDRNDDVRALINHDKNYVLGRTLSNTLELSENPRGLRCYIKVPDVSYARDLRTLMERGDINQMSFAFSEPVTNERWDFETDDDGNVTSALRTILEFDRIFDVSIVTFPAYPQTDASTHGLRSITVGPDPEPEPEVELEPESEADPTDTDSELEPEPATSEPEPTAEPDEVSDTEPRRGANACHERVSAAKRRLALVNAYHNIHS